MPVACGEFQCSTDARGDGGVAGEEVCSAGWTHGCLPAPADPGPRNSPDPPDPRVAHALRRHRSTMPQPGAGRPVRSPTCSPVSQPGRQRPSPLGRPGTFGSGGPSGAATSATPAQAGPPRPTPAPKPELGSPEGPPRELPRKRRLSGRSPSEVSGATGTTGPTEAAGSHLFQDLQFLEPDQRRTCPPAAWPCWLGWAWLTSPPGGR